MLRVLIFLVSLGARALRAMCRRRADLVIENLALRQQVTALKKERPHPATARRRSSLPGRTPKLVARVGESPAHRQRGYSSPVASGSVQAILGENIPTKSGRPRVDAEIRRLIRLMAQDGLGAPRIPAILSHGPDEPANLAILQRRSRVDPVLECDVQRFVAPSEKVEPRPRIEAEFTPSLRE